MLTVWLLPHTIVSSSLRCSASMRKCCHHLVEAHWHWWGQEGEQQQLGLGFTAVGDACQQEEKAISPEKSCLSENWNCQTACILCSVSALGLFNYYSSLDFFTLLTSFRKAELIPCDLRTCHLLCSSLHNSWASPGQSHAHSLPLRTLCSLTSEPLFPFLERFAFIPLVQLIMFAWPKRRLNLE